MEYIGIWVEVVLVFGGVLAFGGWQIYATNRDQRKSREAREAKEREEKLRAEKRV
jgi:hypothetical protein